MAAPGKRRDRILVWLLGLLFLVGVLPLLYTSYKLVTEAQDMLRVGEREIQGAKATSLSQRIKLYVGGARHQIASIARALEADTDRPFPERLRKLKSPGNLVASDDILHLRIVNVDCAGVGAGTYPHEPALESALDEGCARGASYVSQPIVTTSTPDHEPLLVIGEPVMKDKQAEGAVLSVVTLQPLRAWARADAGYYDVYVVDVRGFLLAHSNEARERREDRDWSKFPIVKHLLETPKGIMAYNETFVRPEDGAVMVGTFSRVPDDSGWGVIVQVEERTAFTNAYSMLWFAIKTVGVVALGAALLGFVFSQQITRPIRELVRGALQLAGGDYATRVSDKANNEVGTLAEAFNKMGEAIQKAIEEVRRQAAINKELFMGSIRMLANAIDEKDPYTRGHSERVAYYSACVARYMGMPDEEVERVHLSGIIHDVGKIGIEDAILRKPSALTDDEYEVMKQHPRKGQHILEAVPLLKEMAGSGLMHHENYDGSGYPDGLKGDEIPLLGRIVSVADAFDAMTTDRPYSKAMTFEAAVARLRFLAGKKFDAVCVEAMEKALAAGDLSPAKARRAAVAARKAS